MKKYVPPTNPNKSKSKQPDKTKIGENKKVQIKNVGNNITEQKNTKKKVIYKSQNITPSKHISITESVIKKNDTPKKRKHPEYGTSNLETYFAKNFLNKLGIKYETQFKAESIGRYYDFYLSDINVIFEINGSYWHSDPRLYEDTKLNPTQKKNKRVDKIKNKWAVEHKIPIYYFWEKDINENPDKVLNEIMEIIKVETKNYILKENKKKRYNKNE